jgi:hypothetical protein
MPVLPLVGSMIVVPALILPSRSPASIMDTPIRSFTEPIGLKNSSLARMFAFAPRCLGRRLSRTRGVSPIVSVIELKMRPRPASRAGVLAGFVMRSGSTIENSSFPRCWAVRLPYSLKSVEFLRKY